MENHQARSVQSRKKAIIEHESKAHQKLEKQNKNNSQKGLLGDFHIEIQLRYCY